MFFTYRQNNTHGIYLVDKFSKHFVIIEANSAERADEEAEKMGIYFDGVEKGIDCPCCGDRWHRAQNWEGEEEPLIYGKRPEDFVKEEKYFKYEVLVCYMDGRKEIIK